MTTLAICQSSQPHINPSVHILTLGNYMIISIFFWRIQDKEYDTQYTVLLGTLSLFIDIVQPHQHKHTYTNILTPDRCHTALRTQCRAGNSCRTHTGWVPGPSSPPYTAGDKYAPLSLKAHPEKTEHDAHCTYCWLLLLQTRSAHNLSHQLQIFIMQHHAYHTCSRVSVGTINRIESCI